MPVAVGNEQSIRTIRDEFAALSTRHPEFTGVWIDADGTPVISMTTASNPSPAMLKSVSDWLVSFNRPDLARINPRTKQVPYGFTALLPFLEIARASAGANRGVASLGIDETQGRLAVGVTSESVGAEVLQDLLHRGVPENAIRIWETGNVQEIQAGLQSTFPNIMGGIQTMRNGGDACSIGFVGWAQQEDTEWPYPDFTKVVVTTAAHCTSSQLGVYGDVFGQPGAGRRIGIEIDEATVYWSGSPYCGAYTMCRFADVAVIRLDDTVSSWPTRAAKSSSVTSGNPPYLGWQNYTGSGIKGVLVGDVVRKVGRTTGETNATVAASCEDMPSNTIAGLWTLCSVRAPWELSPVTVVAPYSFPIIPPTTGLRPSAAWCILPAQITRIPGSAQSTRWSFRWDIATSSRGSKDRMEN